MIEDIKREIIKFLAADGATVLVIKGPWGVGKTFAWNSWLKDASENGKVINKQYSYVSLFGCNSLDEFKTQVFEQTIPTATFRDDLSVKSVTENIKSVIESSNTGIGQVFLGKFNQLNKFLETVPFVKEYTSDLWRMGWLLTRDVLVCVDDLERIGENLRIKDVCGLISILKEQKNCKIVIILNDEEISEKNKTDYDNYREKIVDIELKFQPETAELVKLVFSANTPHYDVIQQCIVNLGVTNLRTIQKIKWHLERLKELLNQAGDDYYTNAIRSIVLFTVLHFSRPLTLPTLNEVLEVDVQKYAVITYNASRRQNEQGESQKKHSERFKNLAGIYNWGGSDDIDQIFGDYVRKGYINADRLQDLIEKSKQDQEKIRLKNEAYRLHTQVGDLLWERFDNNVDTLISSMSESIRTSVELYPSIEHLNQYVTILREIKQDAAAHKLIEDYIDVCSNKPSSFLKVSGANISFSGTIDDELRQMLQSEYEEKKKKEIEKNATTVDRQSFLLEVAERCKTWRVTEGDYELLSKFDTKDIEEFFRVTADYEDTRKFLEVFLGDTAAVSSRQNEHDLIKGIIKPAIVAISSESPLNEFRMRSSLKKLSQ